MKATVGKNSFIVAFAVAALANAPSVLSDSFNETLGAGNANFAPTDVYRLVCPNGTASVRARVTNPNGNGADEMTVQVIAPNGRVRSAISLEGVTPYPTAGLLGGAGSYLVAVHKDSTAAVAPYSIFLDCFTAAPAAIPGVQSALIQDQ